jgi:NAD(P)-dependent dehydrogenase (short-subunit alcohol dehydrogenase family)
MGDTAGRSILVTGAASGIGAALCRRIAAPGINLLIHTGSRRAAADAVAEACTADGARCAVETGDLAEPETARRLVTAADERFGGLDALVANAGFADKRRLGALDEAGLERALAVMLKGFFRLADAARPQLARSPAGRIVAVSSFVAHRFRIGEGEGYPASAAAKAGMEALARSLAEQLAAERITVNCVAPGYIRKDAGTHGALNSADWQRAAARIPLGRLGTPDDIAAAIAFLIGSDAGYITGQTIHIDGGLTL